MIYPLGLLAFLATFSQVVMVPLLVEIAREFDTTTGSAALTITAFSVPGIVLGFGLGPLSDRYGRRPLLFGGAMILGSMAVLGAASPSLEVLVLTRAVAGAGASAIVPNIYATIADHVAYVERAQFASTIVALGMIGAAIGIPVAGILADVVSWRATLAITGLLVLGIAVISRPPGREVVHSASRLDPRAAFAQIARDGSALAALGSNFLNQISYQIWAVFMVAFLVATYGLSTAVASTIAGLNSLGILVGSQFGGRLSRNLGYRRLLGWTVAAGAGAVLAVVALQPPLAVAAVLLFLVACFAGGRTVANSSLLGGQVPRARGTMLSMAASLSSAGIAIASAFGGAVLDADGFRIIGFVSVGTALLALLLLWAFVREPELRPNA